MRKGDVVGRYGGEEFAVGLEDTSLEQAQQIVDEVRTLFASLTHYAADTEFRVTLSGGLASSTDFADVGAISAAADLALYRAKAGGRNQIQVTRG
jgi:diguanylate cyclase (GGDEF)-like protein